MYQRYKNYILYKAPVSKTTQTVVRYAHTVLGIDIRPPSIIERMHPPLARELPSIYGRETGIWYVGYDAVVMTWYEGVFNVPNVVKKSTDWFAENHDYRIQRFYRASHKSSTNNTNTNTNVISEHNT